MMHWCSNRDGGNDMASDYGRKLHADHTNKYKISFYFRTIYRKLLTEFGAVLLRGFPLGDIQPLNTFLTHLGDNVKPISYKSGVGIRKNIGGMASRYLENTKSYFLKKICASQKFYVQDLIFSNIKYECYP